MTDEPKPSRQESAEFSLPVSSETDPKSDTIISRSETLKRMISAFQTKELPAISVVDAALDVNRSADTPAPAPTPAPDASDALEKTVYRLPTIDATIAAPPAADAPLEATKPAPVSPV